MTAPPSTVRITLGPHGQTPVQKTRRDAGFDVYAAEDAVVPPRGRCAVSTQLHFADVPPGMHAEVHSRSGLAFKHGITAFPGVIDNGYRGEIRVLLLNGTDDAYIVERGHRIAQLVFVRAPDVELRVCEAQSGSSTERGSAGFGSTGK